MRKGVRFAAKKSNNEWIIIPTFGIINERHYYGYPVVAVAFAWLKWRCKVELGAKKWRADDGNTT